MSGILEIVGPALLPAIAGLLFLLRLDARRFGITEDPGAPEPWRRSRRATWVVLSLALLLLAYAVYPQRISQLHLDLGPDRGAAFLGGLLLGLAGAGAAAAFAWLQLGGARIPPAEAMPVGLGRRVLLAFIDEAAFRGVILGALIVWGIPDPAALLLSALLYAAALARTAGRSRVVPLAAFLFSLVAGVLVLATGGIGAAVLGHALAASALWLLTGGLARAGRADPEAAPPDGWTWVPSPRAPEPPPDEPLPAGLALAAGPPSLAWTGLPADRSPAPWQPPAAWATDPAPTLPPGWSAGPRPSSMPPPGLFLPPGAQPPAPAGPPPGAPAPAPSRLGRFRRRG